MMQNFYTIINIIATLKAWFLRCRRWYFGDFWPYEIVEYDLEKHTSKTLYKVWMSYFFKKPVFPPAMNPDVITTIVRCDGKGMMIKNHIEYDSMFGKPHYIYAGLLNTDISYLLNRFSSSFTMENGITFKDILIILLLEKAITEKEFYNILMCGKVTLDMVSHEIQTLTINIDDVFLI
jgi:hypothetical protein